MNRFSLALLTLLIVSAGAYGQSVARLDKSLNLTRETDDQLMAARAITALKRLDRDVIVYRSLGDFEDDGRIARVSFEAFTENLTNVTAEVEPMLSGLPESKLKTEITNALDSFRDGAFWWRKIHQPRVVAATALDFSETAHAPSDTAFLATVPYTVAIHWRQADRYLKRAEEMMNGMRK